VRLIWIRSSLLSLVLATVCGLSACNFDKNYVNSDIEPVSEEQLRSLQKLIDEGQPLVARTQLKALCEQQPGSVEARRFLQDLRREDQEKAKFVQEYRDAVREHPDDAIAHYLLGRALIEEPEAAALEFEKAAALSPENPWPSIGLAYLSRSRGDLFATVSTYRTAVSLAPRSARLRWFLGTLYLDLRLLVDALRELKLAQRLDPDNPQVWGALGRVHMDMGNYRLAHDELLRARDAMPELVEIYPPLAELYLRWRCPKKATGAYRVGLDLGMPANSQLEGRLRALELVAGQDAAACDEPVD
jgi:protein O-GlcNAc transferase